MSHAVKKLDNFLQFIEEKASQKPVKILLITLGAIFIGLLAFQYAQITNFPIGDDPAIHIQHVTNLSYGQILTKSTYPISLIIFKFLHQISHVDYPKLFTILISAFLFIDSLLLGLLVKKATDSWFVGFISAAIFSLGRWTVDGLRMGLLPEAFGWGVLLLTLYFLAQQNLILTLLSSTLLVFSHPFSFTIFCLILVCYFIITLFSKDKKIRKFSINLLLSYLIIAGLILIFYPSLITKFLRFSNPEVIGWGERNLWIILNSDDTRRLYIPIIALIGLIVSIKNWGKTQFKILYLLLFVGLFMSLNQIFSIRFLVFRFFPYLEMGLAVFASLGLIYISNQLKINHITKWTLIFVLSFFLLYPNYHANHNITYYQANDIVADTRLSIGDQEAIKWISKNINPNQTINAPGKKDLWLDALIGYKNLSADERPYDQKQTTALYASGQKYSYPYIYYSRSATTPEEVKKNYDLIYDRLNTRIYGVKP